jgi:hypothetical protein
MLHLRAHRGENAAARAANCGIFRAAGRKGGKACFFEKKQQKNFGRFDFGAAADAQPGPDSRRSPQGAVRFGRHIAERRSPR